MERMTMCAYRLAIPMFLGLSLGVFADCAWAPTASAQQTDIAPTQPGMARVWFLRPSGSVNGDVIAAAPVISVNGQPIGDIPAGTDFYRAFAPGTYRFTVQPYGLPTGQADTVQLAAGTQTYLEIQWVSSADEGYPEGGWRFGTQYLRCIDDVAAAGAGISPHIDASRSALNLRIS